MIFNDEMAPRGENGKQEMRVLSNSGFKGTMKWQARRITDLTDYSATRPDPPFGYPKSIGETRHDNSGGRTLRPLSL